MRFIVLFFDSLVPSKQDPSLTKQHFQYLKKHESSITQAGGLKPPQGGEFCGSLWVLHVANYEAARQLVENEPYCKAGLRPNYQIYFWNQAPIGAHAETNNKE